jgi:hypothetical protein
MPTIDLTDDELAAVIAAVRRTIREDTLYAVDRGVGLEAAGSHPGAAPLKAALAKLVPTISAMPRRTPKPLPALKAKPTHDKRGLRNR